VIVAVPTDTAAFVTDGGSGAAGNTNDDDGADAADAPTPFLAVIVHVYVLPALNVVTTATVTDNTLDLVAPPFDELQVALAPIIDEPLSAPSA
jgi:hypothetical protein